MLASDGGPQPRDVLRLALRQWARMFPIWPCATRPPRRSSRENARGWARRAWNDDCLDNHRHTPSPQAGADLLGSPPS